MTSYTLPSSKIAITPFYDKSQPLYSLVNFSQHAVTIDGITYPTTEHFFQAQKFDSNQQAFLQEVAKRGNGPAAALAVAREWTKNWTDAERNQWYTKNEKVMEKALRAKLAQHPTIAQELLSTGNSCLVEDTSEKNEKIWGWGNDGSGTNKLGIVWMTLRNELLTAQGKTGQLVDPKALYKEVQKIRLPLGQRNHLMQHWPDAIASQTTPTPLTQQDSIVLLAADVSKTLQKGQSAEAVSHKGSKLQYGISGQFGSFYIRGTDRNGKPIDVYVKNDQIFENNRQVTKSTWAQWALPIIRKSLNTPVAQAPASAPTIVAPNTQAPAPAPTIVAPNTQTPAPALTIAAPNTQASAPEKESITTDAKGKQDTLLRRFLLSVLAVGIVVAGAFALNFTLPTVILIGFIATCSQIVAELQSAAGKNKFDSPWKRRIEFAGGVAIIIAGAVAYNFTLPTVLLIGAVTSIAAIIIDLNLKSDYEIMNPPKKIIAPNDMATELPEHKTLLLRQMSPTVTSSIEATTEFHSKMKLSR